MGNDLKAALQHLDAAHVANRRIASVSILLMASENQDLLEVEDLRVLADLIHSQTEIVRDCLGHFMQIAEANEPNDE